MTSDSPGLLEDGSFDEFRGVISWCLSVARRFHYDSYKYWDILRVALSQAKRSKVRRCVFVVAWSAFIRSQFTLEHWLWLLEECSKPEYACCDPFGAFVAFFPESG